MRVTASNCLLVFGVLLICSAQAYAQPLFDATQSIETTVINSDYVFIAKLVDFRPKKEGRDRYLHEGNISIEETLKCEHFRDEPYSGLNVDLPYRESVLQDWKQRSSRLLVALTSFDGEQNVVIELAPETLEVMTAEVKLLRDPEAVIRAARAAVKRLPANVKRVHTFDLTVPRDVLAGTRWDVSYQTGGYLRLSVPADQHLEKRAQDYIRSDDPQRRSEGAKALVYSKSDKNIALIKPLLDDSHFSFYSRDGSTAGERSYPVRHAAYETLKEWGVDVKKPVYLETVR